MIKKIILMVAIILFCTNAVALPALKFKPHINKEIAVLVTMKYRTSINNIWLKVLVEDVILVNGYYYIAIKGETENNIYIPCDTIKEVRR